MATKTVSDKDGGLLKRGEHIGAPGASDAIVALINARFEDVVFVRLGEVELRVANGQRGGNPTNTLTTMYAALIERHTTMRALAVAFCTKLTQPATTIDKLPWMQFHLRSYTDEELGDLFTQVRVNWDNLGAPQELHLDPYDRLKDVPIARDVPNYHDRARRDRSTETYRTRDGTIALTLRSQRSDGRGLSGNDLPKSTTFVPALELFDTVIWFA